VRAPIRLPDAVRNPVSLVGMVIATTMAVLFIALLLLDASGAFTNPYIGLLVFVTVPVIFVIGLLLVPIGGWWQRRRRRRDPALADWPVIDLRDPRQRSIAATVLALTIVNIVIVSLAAYGGVHYMDSSQFCGQVCHTTMEPEYVAYQAWPHARVECAQCHIGPGTRALVQAKLAGTRQLYHVLTNQVPKPVPAPRELVSSPQETCARCHWPEQVHGDRLRVIREYANDEKNSESVTTLQLHVGGGSARLGIGTGIHWHMNIQNRVDFVETANGEIPYVRLTDAAGRVREFVGKGASREQYAAAPSHRMDCIDCHNRPAHTMFFSAERAIDTAIAQGRIPRELAFVRRESVAAVKASYPDAQSGRDRIASRLRDFYAMRPGTDARLVRRAVAGAQQVWSENVFPAMHVQWGTYANNIGHVDSPGCFRCHDDDHTASDGTAIRQDCELCHTAPQ
jgi:nitrate/TMAO reductase-like tetraheme cytochrome c subunit